MGEQLTKDLLEHKNRQNNDKIKLNDIYRHDLDLVFAKQDGTFLPKSSLFNAFERILKHAEIPYMSIHCLRDTHAVLLLESGRSMNYIKDRLRHRSIDTTFNFYGHISRKIEQDSIEEFDKYMTKINKATIE